MAYESFDLKHGLDASILGEKIKAALFEKLEEEPKEVVALTSFLVAPALALITLITKVATIVELLFKATLNLVFGMFFAPDSMEDAFSTVHLSSYYIAIGKKQLCALIPAAIDLIFGAPVHMLCNLTVDFLGLLSSPFSNYVECRQKYHENKIDELMGAKSYAHLFQFLLKKAHENGVKADELNTIIDRLKVGTNLTEKFLEKIRTEFDFAMEENAHFVSFLPSMNLKFYGDDHNRRISYEYMHKYYQGLKN